MSDIVDQITAVLREELSLDNFEGDHMYEGTIDPRELAERIVAELGMTAVRCADERWWSTRIERGVY